MTKVSGYFAQDRKRSVNGTDNSGRTIAPKEVDSMNSNLNPQTAQIAQIIPSTFGMPACGHAFGSGDIAVQAEVRVKGDMGLSVRTYAPGPQAWRPPTS
jgi:hypothetical protein